MMKTSVSKPVKFISKALNKDCNNFAVTVVGACRIFQQIDNKDIRLYDRKVHIARQTN